VTEPSVVEVEARSYELDAYDHLNNAVYVNWLEHGRLNYLRDRGHTYTTIPEHFGVHVVVVRSDLSYRRQVRLGDRLRIVTRLARLGRTSFAFRQEILFGDGTVAADGEVTMVCVGPDERARPVPAGLREVLES
jgi:YbgC/YbaW family acyl-CoA thioester hydrolase